MAGSEDKAQRTVARQFRARAELARCTAQEMTRPTIRRQLLRLADEYEGQASRIESEAPSSSSERSVLIVEDNELNLKLLRDFLQHHGYCVLAAARGEGVPELARAYQPDLIVLDIQLPGISGMQTARRLKNDPETRKIPIVAVTAFGMSADRLIILGSGCDDYMAKPVNLLTFLELVKRYTGHQNQTLSRDRNESSPIAPEV
jgi:two-component system cell cycle response regulator DivK